VIRGKRLFITGGAGFIGASLIRRLVAANEVVVYDTLTRNTLGDLGLAGHPNVTMITGDIRDYEHLRRSLPPAVDIVLHFAAIAGVDTVSRNPVATIEVNTIGTHHILRAIRERGLVERLERFINFSTSEVFGINAFRVDEMTASNLQPVGEARWTYAASKLVGEHLVHGYHRQFGLRTVTIRPFNVYGPGQVGEGAVHHFVQRAIRNEPLVIHGEGDQIRSWCYIDDMVEGILLCLANEAAIGEVFNIGNPRGTITILALAEKVIALARSSSSIVHVPKSYVDVDLRIPSIEKARSVLGFEPQVGLDEGLRRTIAWYRHRLETRSRTRYD
jgi:dTDP-glucose 4,6-dehydratase